MNSGIATLTGQPSTQKGFLQLMQRCASSIAISGVYPRATSLKLPFLTSGSCSGILILVKDILGIHCFPRHLAFVFLILRPLFALVHGRTADRLVEIHQMSIELR